MTIQIDKVITKLLKPEQMQTVNKITQIDIFASDNWCGKGQFEETPQLAEFITTAELFAIQNNNADYITFRLDN